MQQWTRHLWTHRRATKIMHDLGGRTDHDDLVFEERAVLIVGMPDLVVENFPKRTRGVSIDVAEA